MCRHERAREARLPPPQPAEEGVSDRYASFTLKQWNDHQCNNVDDFD
jgi:hypothetical protein